MGNAQRKEILEMTETWAPVPGYEGRYEASSEGNVRSLGLVVAAKGGATAFRPGRTLRQAVKSNGYRQVTLVAADGARQSWMTHQVVCLTFKGPCPPGQQVRHKDRTKSNNSVGNLEYGTAVDNAADRAGHSTFKSGWAIYDRKSRTGRRTPEMS